MQDMRAPQMWSGLDYNPTPTPTTTSLTLPSLNELKNSNRFFSKRWFMQFWTVIIILKKSCNKNGGKRYNWQLSSAVVGWVYGCEINTVPLLSECSCLKPTHQCKMVAVKCRISGFCFCILWYASPIFISFSGHHWFFYCSLNINSVKEHRPNGKVLIYIPKTKPNI